jgi:hypothetical protein
VSEHVFDRLSAYLDDELSAAERERFRGHLASCPECARRLEGLAAVDGAIRELPEQAPAGYFEALPGRIRSRLAAAEAPARTGGRVPAWALAMAAALVVGVLAPLTLHHNQQPALPAPALPPEALARMREAPPPQAKEFAPPATLVEAPAPTTLPPMALSVPASGRPPDARAERLEAATRARQSRPEQGTLGADAIVAEAAPRSTSPPAPAAAANGRAQTPEGQPGFARAPQPAAPKLAEQRVAQEAEPRKQEAAQAEAAAALAVVVTASPERRAKEQVAGFADPEDQAAADRLGKTDERGSASGSAKGTQLADGLFTFRALLGRSPRDASEARALREAWRRLAGELAAAAEADEARVRVLEMGAAAWRFERLAEDRALLEKDVAAYLARQDARQAPRVRALRDGLSR